MKTYNFWDAQLFVYCQLFVYFYIISHLEAADTETAQSNDVWNENLEFLRWSAVCLLSADCLLITKNHLEASNTKTAQGKDVWNENFEFLSV